MWLAVHVFCDHPEGCDKSAVWRIRNTDDGRLRLVCEDHKQSVLDS